MNNAGKIVLGVLFGTLVMSAACIVIEKELNKKKKVKMKKVPEFKGNVVDINEARKLRK